VKDSPVLREIRRGHSPDELELITTTGHVTILHAHGLTADEKMRTRERAFALLDRALMTAVLFQRPMTCPEFAL
jgi:hypothetical protein